MEDRNLALGMAVLSSLLVVAAVFAPVKEQKALGSIAGLGLTAASVLLKIAEKERTAR